MSGVAIDQDGAPKAGMGVHAADVDDDGDNDLIVMNLDTESDSFYRNEGRFFVDDTTTRRACGWSAAASRASAWRCSTSTTTAGSICTRPTAASGCRPRRSRPTPTPSPICCSAGSRAERFEEVTPRGGTVAPHVATSRAAAFGDIDNDGGLDIVVANRDAAPHLLRNVVPEPRALAAAAGHSSARAATRSGRGCRWWQADARIRRDVRTGYSYLAANDPRVHVGLGEARSGESVTVRWVDGVRERFGPFAVTDRRDQTAGGSLGSESGDLEAGDLVVDLRSITISDGHP